MYFPEESRIASQICTEHRRKEHSKMLALHDAQLKAATEKEIRRLLRPGRFPKSKAPYADND
jgi:hypothetical protein